MLQKVKERGDSNMKSFTSFNSISERLSFEFKFFMASMSFHKKSNYLIKNKYFMEVFFLVWPRGL